MRTKTILAVALAALVAAGAAFAGNGKSNGRGNGTRAARGIHYAFAGKLTATPANGAVSVTVEGGNHAALHAMMGRPVTQTFAYGDGTEFLQWSQGKPAVVSAGDLAAGHYVRINIRAPRRSSLADLEQVAASLVGDHGTTLNRPSQPLYLFRGTLTAAAGSSVTLDVRGGNRRALRLLLGQPSSQTFTTGGETIFLLWQGKMPTVTGLSQLKVGDRIVVKVRAAAGSTLGQVESTAAVKVVEHERAGGS